MVVHARGSRAGVGIAVVKEARRERSRGGMCMVLVWVELVAWSCSCLGWVIGMGWVERMSVVVRSEIEMDYGLSYIDCFPNGTDIVSGVADKLNPGDVSNQSSLAQARVLGNRSWLLGCDWMRYSTVSSRRDCSDH